VSDRSTKVRLTVEYAGEAFCGWQAQGSLITVQGCLEEALEIYLRGEAKKLGIDAPGRIPIQGSGRTDTGVHARGQVASFSWPAAFVLNTVRLKEALNAMTPSGLIVRAVEEAEESFDARHSPHIKCYSYRILYRGDESRAARFAALEKDRVWVVTRPLDIRGMILAAKVLVGQHDFSSFRARDCTSKSSVRTIFRSEIVRVSSNEIVYFIHGKGFLKQMVRAIVGTLVELGIEHGIDHAAQMSEIISAHSRSAAGKTAPAAGLTMEWVQYDEKYTFK